MIHRDREDHRKRLSAGKQEQGYRARYLRLRERHPGMSTEWWFDTHGIEFSDIQDMPNE